MWPTIQLPQVGRALCIEALTEVRSALHCLVVVIAETFPNGWRRRRVPFGRSITLHLSTIELAASKVTQPTVSSRETPEQTPGHEREMTLVLQELELVASLFNAAVQGDPAEGEGATRHAFSRRTLFAAANACSLRLQLV